MSGPPARSTASASSVRTRASARLVHQRMEPFAGGPTCLVARSSRICAVANDFTVVVDGCGVSSKEILADDRARRRVFIDGHAGPGDGRSVYQWLLIAIGPIHAGGGRFAASAGLLLHGRPQGRCRRGSGNQQSAMACRTRLVNLDVGPSAIPRLDLGEVDRPQATFSAECGWCTAAYRCRDRVRLRRRVQSGESNSARLGTDRAFLRHRHRLADRQGPFLVLWMRPSSWTATTAFQ